MTESEPPLPRDATVGIESAPARRRTAALVAGASPVNSRLADSRHADSRHGHLDTRHDDHPGSQFDDSLDARLARSTGTVGMAPASSPERRSAMQKIGRAVLRLRLYHGWSQRDLEHKSRVDQTTICRLERGKQRGLSIRRLAAILDALHVGEIVFDRPQLIVPQTDLEIMLFGDRWARAGKEADRRLGWPTPTADGNEPHGGPDGARLR